MSKAFTYNATLQCEKFNTAFDLLCVSYGQCGEVENVNFFSDVELGLKNSSQLPDCVVVIAPKALTEQIYKQWKEEIDKKNTLIARGKKNDIFYIKAYYFYAWDFPELLVVKDDQLETTEYSINTEKLVKEGLKFLIQKNPVVQVAPAGHIFRHPSGTKNKIFIQARELATDQPELRFIGEALSLLKGEAFSQASVVLIDTMGIYPYVAEAIAARGGRARIESFHGYGKLMNLSAPVEPYLCIISASTSGGMEKKLIKRGFDPERIVTLIDRPERRDGSVLISLDSISNEFENILKEGAETEIELVGENFTSKAKPPRPVTLGIAHLPKNLQPVLKHFALGGVESINKPRAGKTHAKPISLNVESVLKDNEAFNSWLIEELNWSVPSSVDLIIHADDLASQRIAQSAAEILSHNKGGFGHERIVSHSSLNKSLLDKCKGVLVVSSVAGDGTVLREISRDLRELILTDVPRHYLVAIGLPQNAETWKRLIQFLEKNSTNRRYGFSNWLCLPIGYDGANTAWQAYSELAQKMDLPIEIPESVNEAIAKESLDMAARMLKDNHNGLLPKTDGKELELTEGFLYFEDKFKNKISEIKANVVFLTMSAVIQRARDIDNPEYQLKPTGYESVVIAPECFLRFNDSILQAAILRACNPSELDYSASVELSRLMKEFLVKVFSRYNQTFGDAVLEYAAALATRRLKLKEEDLAELVHISIDRTKHQPSALLGLLIIIKFIGN